ERRQRSEFLKKIHANAASLSKQQYDQLIVDVLREKSTGARKLLRKYDVVEVEGIKKLIAPLCKTTDMQFYVHNEELFELLQEAHLSLKHGGRFRMMEKLRETYKNITFRHIANYLDLCESCEYKRKRRKTMTHVKCEEIENEYVERVTEDLETWMERNRSNKWTECLRFIQFSINRDFHDGIDSTPYDMLFGLSADEDVKSQIMDKTEPLDHKEAILKENLEIVSYKCDNC
ncbi:hypothetical protein BDFB_014337, partial [Asbolus verrucosus]